VAKNKNPRLADLLGVLNQLCPPALAEDWDNVGLQVGDPTAEISRVLIALDAEEAALEQAEQQQAQLIITHHPLIFRPLRRLSTGDPGGQILFRAIRQQIAIASAHTNLDRAANGLNDWLAEHLRLTAIQPLEQEIDGDYYKIVVYVPSGHETAVMEALFAAGAGHIGGYDRCSFRLCGTGTFRGGDSSQPFIGTAGEHEEADELRLETIVPAALLNKTIARAEKAHPYEEMAYDLIPLANRAKNVGLGRIGRLSQPLTLQQFAVQVKEWLQAPALRLVGDPRRQLEKIAVCGGSGMSMYAEAMRQGADCLVTGDIKFHEAQRARAEGLALIDAGHFATERLMIPGLAQRLRHSCQQRQWNLEIIEADQEQDPFVAVD
jgi:dinuclear metal center YbgI/SA1388 family protein